VPKVLLGPLVLLEPQGLKAILEQLEPPDPKVSKEIKEIPELRVLLD
jgi:hypothetical protein